MKAENNYEKLKQIDEATNPLPKEEMDIPTRAIPIDPYALDEPVDRSYVEAEVDIEKHGIPVIDVERPPVPEVHTDETRYKKVYVKRKSKRADKYVQHEEVSLKEDRLMAAYAKELKIPKCKSLLLIIRKKLYELSCKIRRLSLNVKRKKLVRASRHYHEDHSLPENVKRVPLANADDEKVNELGRLRSFKREEDRSPSRIQVIRNKKSGVVVVTPSYKSFMSNLREDEIDNYEVVESQIKD